MKIGSFGVEPPLNDLFPQATWSSQQLGCGREEFALGVAGLFWHPAAVRNPQGSSLSRPSWEWCIALMGERWGLGTPETVVLETATAASDSMSWASFVASPKECVMLGVSQQQQQDASGCAPSCSNLGRSKIAPQMCMYK